LTDNVADVFETVQEPSDTNLVENKRIKHETDEQLAWETPTGHHAMESQIKHLPSILLDTVIAQRRL